MPSEKTAVIQYLFDQYWERQSNTLSKTIMTLDDVKDAIRACNAIDGLTRSDRNPANFLKDVIRSRNASQIWPTAVADLRFTGEQRTGAGDSFEFVPYAADQVEPFPDLFRSTDDTVHIDLQSVSLPRASKKLGRSDEAWLIQTAVNLRVIEQHMATISHIDVQEITHLQMSVKLRATEIDAVYLASVVLAGNLQQAIITCEAKKESERILVGQIISQVKAAFETTDVNLVIPTAIRSVRSTGIHVMEFGCVSRAEMAGFQLNLASDAIYRFVPTVKGI